MLFGFGVAGVLLAAMGTYGLVSYSVRQSRHEIGIRMALGASSRFVVLRFLVRGLRLGAIGAALGMLAALGVTRLLGSMLFGVSATDATSFAVHSPSSSPEWSWPLSCQPGGRHERIR
jgi:putative ABC transport system permease protein